jgi:hypothetical protein
MRYPPGIMEEREREREREIKKRHAFVFFCFFGFWEVLYEDKVWRRQPKSLTVCKKIGCMMKRNYAS